MRLIILFRYPKEEQILHLICNCLLLGSTKLKQLEKEIIYPVQATTTLISHPRIIILPQLQKLKKQSIQLQATTLKLIVGLVIAIIIIHLVPPELFIRGLVEVNIISIPMGIKPM